MAKPTLEHALFVVRASGKTAVSIIDMPHVGQCGGSIFIGGAGWKSSIVCPTPLFFLRTKKF